MAKKTGRRRVAGLAQRYAEYQKGYSEARYFDSWMPDPGEYDAELTDFTDKKVKDQATGETYGQFRLTLRILDGEFADREFSPFPLDTRVTKKGNQPGLGQLKHWAAVLNDGEAPDNLGEALEIIEAAAKDEDHPGVRIRIREVQGTERVLTICDPVEALAAAIAGEEPDDDSEGDDEQEEETAGEEPIYEEG